MRKNIFFLAAFLFMGGLIFTSCEKEEELSDKKEILGFVFEASKNTDLEHNVIGTITGTDVIAEVPFGTHTNSLTPSIEISSKATISPASGAATDFTNPVTYTVTAEDGSTKTFTANVPVAPAPYIGKWKTEISVNISSLGLSHVTIEATESGNFTMELKSTTTGQVFGKSVKGNFDPESVCNVEICLDQTHRWLDGHWTAETARRCMMYNCYDGQMEFKYCESYPMDEWLFTVHLLKDE